MKDIPVDQALAFLKIPLQIIIVKLHALKVVNVHFSVFDRLGIITLVIQTTIIAL